MPGVETVPPAKPPPPPPPPAPSLSVAVILAPPPPPPPPYAFTVTLGILAGMVIVPLLPAVANVLVMTIWPLTILLNDISTTNSTT